MSKVVELFGLPTAGTPARAWGQAVKSQRCPYLGKKCIKVRKSKPDVSIGTCTVNYGKESLPVVICPYRLLERRQVFTDSLHLLSRHEPGNELHVIPEITIPGGSVDYFIVSARSGKAIDFVGIELQTLDTTGTVWPERQRFLHSVGVTVERAALRSEKAFGMNWKMTAKTILMQLHHKVETFEHLSKHIVLAVQDRLMGYMSREFSFGHLSDPALIGDAAHLHTYSMSTKSGAQRLQLARRFSTDAAGIAAAIGLQAQAKVELESILADVQRKLSDKTLWTPA